jgi:hypothetical protein
MLRPESSGIRQLRIRQSLNTLPLGEETPPQNDENQEGETRRSSTSPSDFIRNLFEASEEFVRKLWTELSTNFRAGFYDEQKDS